MPKNEQDSNIVTDEWGEEWEVLRGGERRVPMQTSQSRKTESGFLEYDTSRGHCGLCGRLDCNGGCFK